jgi:membrane associated rhomboid family serine protease
MIPIGDLNPRRHFPLATILIIALNVVVFFYQLLLPDEALNRLVLAAGVVPYEVTNRFGVAVVGDLLTSMFLHGGWMHIISNMLYLWIFGDNVEDRLGLPVYAAFYLVAGIGASLAQVAVNPASTIPTIGASGAIAGVLGAYLVMFPKTRVRTLILAFRFIRIVELPALVVLGLWFVLQIFSGLASVTSMATGGVAWFAHIGGFVIGILVGLFYKTQRDRGPHVRFDW